MGFLVGHNFFIVCKFKVKSPCLAEREDGDFDFLFRPIRVVFFFLSLFLNILNICPRMMFEITAKTSRSKRDLWEDIFTHARGEG